MRRECRQCIAHRGRREHPHGHHRADDQHAPERDAAHDGDGLGAEVQPAASCRVDQRPQCITADQRAGEYGEGGEGDVHATYSIVRSSAIRHRQRASGCVDRDTGRRIGTLVRAVVDRVVIGVA